MKDRVQETEEKKKKERKKNMNIGIELQKWDTRTVDRALGTEKRG
jgi:hypothetical protein